MTEPAPITLRLILLAVFVLVGLLQAVVGFRGLRGELRPGGRVGVRTSAALRGEPAFVLANQIAGPAIMVGGLVAIAGGALLFVMHTTAATVVVAVIALLGMVTISAAGGLRGHRAAAAMPATEPAAAGSGCGGCACGSASCAAAS